MKKGTIITVFAIIIIVIGVIFWARSTSHQESLTTDTGSTDDSMMTKEEDTTMDTQENGAMSDDSAAVITASGLSYTVLKQGTGAGAENGQSVSVNYTGMLTNGTVFDSNVDPKFGHVKAFTFSLGAGMVIKGWDEGVLGMKVGEKRHLVIPAELAYGARSPSPLIPANSVLEFDVEVTAIQ